MRVTKRLMIGAALGAAALLVPAVPAAADTAIFDDPGGDADPRVDIFSFGADYDGSTILVAAWVAEPSDPFSDPNWTQSPYTYVRFGLDAGSDGDLDYLAYLYTDLDGSPVAQIRDFDGNDVCSAEPIFEDGFYAVGFDAACIDTPASFDMNASAFYDTDVNDPAAPVVEDHAPDGVDTNTGAGSVAGPITAGATDTIEDTEQVHRAAGVNRIETAVEVSRSGFDDQSADAVVLATAFNYPDALVGVPLAAHHAGPLLLTPAENLDGAVGAEIQRVLPSGGEVYMLGGTGVLSDGVASQLSAMGYRPVRLAGQTRYDTALAVARHIGSPSRIFVATGRDFPDALIAGAAAASFGGILLLSDGPVMPAATKAYIYENSGVARTAVGDPAVAADPQATPIQGADRYETSVRVATHVFGSGSLTGGGFGLASGANFPDALSGGARVAVFGGPILLTRPDALPDRVRNYLQSNAHNYSFGYAFGGTAAISDGVRAAAQSAIAG